MSTKAKEAVRGSNTGRPAVGIAPGEEFSLNLQRTHAAHIGPFILNYDNPFAIVPMDAPASLLLALDNARLNGLIVMGHKDLRVQGDQEVLSFYIGALNLRSFVQIKEYIIGLAKTRTRISGWKPKQLLEEMLKTESRTNNRRDVVDYLNMAIRCSTEPSLADVPFDKNLHAKSKTILKRPLVRPTK